MTLAGFARLGRRDKAALLRAAAAVAIVRAGLHVLPADRLARLLGLPLLLAEQGAAIPASWEDVPVRRRAELRMLGRVLRRRPPRSASPCLQQSLALGLLLRSSRPRLRIGVARDAEGVRAHAWLEAGGRSYFADPLFLPLGVKRAAGFR